MKDLAWSGVTGVSQVSVSQIMLQSRMSLWYLILALRSSSLFSSDWTLASRMLGSGGLCARLLSLFLMPARFPLGLFSGLEREPLSPLLLTVALRTISLGQVGSDAKLGYCVPIKINVCLSYVTRHRAGETNRSNITKINKICKQVTGASTTVAELTGAIF